MANLPDSDHAGKTGRAGSRYNWRTVLQPIDTTRRIARRELSRSMVISLAVKFATQGIVGGKGARP